MTIKLLSLAMAAGLAMSAPAANAALYNISQTGFDGGASVSGSFEASDLNTNGLLQGSVFTNFNEISSFTLSFSGNSIVPAFTHTLADLTFLGHDTSKTTMGTASTEGIATNWFGTSGYTYVSGVATNGQQGAGIINWLTSGETTSPNTITVTPSAVPVPGAVWLFGSALAGFISVARRKS